MFENININQIYMSLIKLCDVNGFDVSTLRKINSLDPEDLFMTFYPRPPITVPLETIKSTVSEFIAGEVNQVNVSLNTKKNLVVYIEFTNCSIR